MMANLLAASSTPPQAPEAGSSTLSSLLTATGLLKTVSCQSLNGQGYIKRADTQKLRSVFEKYASLEVEGVKYMTDEDFVIKYLELLPEAKPNKESLQLLCGVLDTSKDGRISFAEFQAFEGSLCVPDALYKTAFHLFDTNGNGTVSFDEFLGILSKTTLHKKIPFNYECDFIKLYFGKEKDRVINYNEFSQFLHDFSEEYATVAFKAKDKEGSGFISSADFEEVMQSVKSHLLTPQISENLRSIAHNGPNGQSVSYAFFVAFLSLLSNMELIKKVYLNATNGSRTQEITKEEFLYSAQMMSQITPLETDILFLLCDLFHQTGKVMYSDFQEIAPEQYMKQVTKRLVEIKAVEKPEDRSALTAVLESVYRFTLGSIAGATGATAVYPIDLVKTRMQNQRTGSYIGELMYRNSFDCFKKVLRHEGFTGLYRGLVPQLVGVAPEKAIKLTMNDLMRDKMTADGKIPLWGEVLAGACGGGSQVMFTNPLEIVKIRLQVAGEIAGGQRISAFGVIKELGFFGLYKGSRACFLRDVPFSAIYFPAYAHLKPAFADENGYNSPLSLLTAGAIAGMPAASLVTPADVIKTRLQVKARAGQTTYNGLTDAAKKIYMEEGFAAFWKGAVARMCRSSPQFGVTLVTYELLQRTFNIDFGGSKPSGQLTEATGKVDKSDNPDHIGGYQVARPIFLGVESKFGLLLPKFSHQ